MNVLQQTARMGRLSTVLGKDVLNLVRFDGQEAVNDLFSYQVEALATRDDLDFDALLGTHATVALTSFDKTDVAFDGIVTDMRMKGATPAGWRYELILRPWIWLMSLRRKQQIFHEMTVVEIIEELIAPYGHPVENRLTGSYPTLEYTVQYRESDLACMTRLMERFGISYHFVHANGVHTLVLTDAVDQHDDAGARPLRGVDAGHRDREEHFWRMVPARRITTGAIRLTDYNFKTPTAAMEADKLGDVAHAEGQWESYDYPGLYLDQGQGKGVASLRKDQERGQAPRVEGEGDCASLRAGHRVKVTGEKVHGVSKCLCLSATHSYTAGDYGASAGAGEEAYTGAWVFMPDDAPLAPEMKTPRAVVQGPHTGTVVGEGEIDCDEYGRILVHFHWDLDCRISMRCRVSQNWAGKGWGGMVIPRIGMEVVVEFLEGDPDKPLVTGCVYNGKNDTPYPLPEHKTKSVFRSDSHKSKGFNELTFEDEKGIENLFTHAQKDKTSRILNDQIDRMDRHHVTSIGSNKVVDIGHNLKTEVGQSMNTVVGGTGVSAIALMASVAGLAPHTAGMMKQAGDIAGGVGGLGVFVGSLASSALGFLSPLGLSSRQGVVAPSSHLPDAGKALKEAGSKIGEQADQLFPAPGIMNTIVGSFKSDTIGIAQAEQVGVTKVVNVGQVMIESVGKYRKIAVGEEFVIECGDSKLVMKSNGEIMILGKKFNFVATDHFQMRGKPIDLN